MSKWNPQIPLNFRTGMFCFLMGTALSLPVGFLPTKILFFEIPLVLMNLYQGAAVACFLILPFWSYFAVRKYSPLPTLGLITFVFFILCGLLFPAVSVN